MCERIEWEPVKPVFTPTAAAVDDNKSRTHQEAASLTAPASSNPPLFVTMQLSVCKSPPVGRRPVFWSAGNDCSHNNNATGSKCQEGNCLSDWSGLFRGSSFLPVGARIWAQPQPPAGRRAAPYDASRSNSASIKGASGDLLLRLFPINLREDGNLTARASVEGSAEAGA